jgi:hypothetical protein
MADRSEQIDHGGSSEFPDGAIRSFLLGRLSAAERRPFEARLFTDETLETRVRLAEYELVDDYIFDRLGLSDRKLFERKFLLSADRKQKLSVSRALRDHFAPGSAAQSFEEKATLIERLRVLLAPTQPARRFALGVLLFLLLVGTLWLVIREPRIAEKVFVRPSRLNRAVPLETPEAHHPTGEAPIHHDDSSSPKTQHESAVTKTNPTAQTESTPAANMLLFPATSPESGQRSILNLPRDEHDLVRLELWIEPNQPGTYGAELLTLGGQSVLSIQSLKAVEPDGSKIYLDVSADLLRPGAYQINLSRVSDGSAERVTTYYFRAIERK